jgi:integrase
VPGSITRRQKADGRDCYVWTLRADAPRDPKSPTKRQQVTASFTGTRAAAEAAAHRFAGAAKTKTPGRGLITYSEVFELWQNADSFRQRPRALTTKDHDALRFNKWIAPEFGNRAVEDVKPTEIQAFYARVRLDEPGPTGRKGLGPNSVVRLHSLLAAMTNYAYREQLIETKPLDFVIKPRGQVLPPRSPDKQYVDMLIDYLWDNDRQMYLAVRFASGLGLRRSEIICLKWSDFIIGHLIQDGTNQPAATLRVQRGLVAVPKRRREGNEPDKFIITDTKTGAASHRNLSLDTKLRKAMEAMYHVELTNCYIFSEPGHGDTPWHPDTLNRKLDKYRRAAYADHPALDQVRLTFRSLRIYCASRIYYTNNDIRKAAAVLGHSSISTSERYYVAFRDEQHRQVTIGIGDEFTH